jgi:hypothetical protein
LVPEHAGDSSGEADSQSTAATFSEFNLTVKSARSTTGCGWGLAIAYGISFP